MKYDNSILLKSSCDIYKDEMTMNCIGNSCESFKSIKFKLKDTKYGFKLLDICNFLKGVYQVYLKNYQMNIKLLQKNISQIILNYSNKKHVFHMNG